MTLGVAYTLLAGVWIIAAILGGAILALLAQRIYSGLSYRKLWAFYSMLLAAAAGVFYLIAAF